MKKHFGAVHLVITCVLLSLSSPVLADRFSVQVGANHSTADTVFIGGEIIGQPPPELASVSSFSGTSFRVGATARVYRWLHVDAGWAKFGDEGRHTSYFVGRICPGTCPDDEDAFILENVQQSGSGYWISLAPTFENGPWQVLGKLGVARTTIESRQHSVPHNRLQSSETGVMFGVGAAYYFTDNLGVRGDFERLGSEARQFGLSLSAKF